MPELGEDKELEAIQAVMSALDTLEPEARERVVDYVTRRLGITAGYGFRSSVRAPSIALSADTSPTERENDEPAITDIRSLTAVKAPRTANEMAAIVAFYLAELAPFDEKKDTITPGDITKYFKQARFRLPGAARFTLKNAAAAGYLDSVARGEYRINPVGYNLVAHYLPRKSETSSGSRSVHGARRTPKPRTVKTQAKPEAQSGEDNQSRDKSAVGDKSPNR